jgi:hypothetical protein
MNGQYINILADGTVLTTKWKRVTGEKVMHAGKQKEIKFSLNQAEYDQCLENRKELVDDYFTKKAKVINGGTAFTQDVKAQTASYHEPYETME